MQNQNKLLIFGGYCLNKKRSKLIEIYDIVRDTWEFHSMKLMHGVEWGVIIKYSNFEIIILGGRNWSGDTNFCIKYNFKD